MKKRLVKIAERIVELEKEAQESPSSSRPLIMMEKLISQLNFSELLQIDEYIQENKLLTK